MAIIEIVSYIVEMTEKTKLDTNGRVVLPAGARRALGLTPGDELAIEVRDGAVVLRPFSTSAAKAHARVREVLGAQGVEGLADALIADRKRGLWRE
jgi:AbrB family looped-hinge helix DNA binding protein